LYRLFFYGTIEDIIYIKIKKVLTLSTASLKWYGIHKIFTIAKKANYEGIDLKLEMWNYDSLDSDYIKSLSDAFQIPVVSVEAPPRGMNKKRVDEVVAIAKILWSQVVTFTPPHILDKDTKWFTDYLPRLNKTERMSLSIKNVASKFIFFVIPEHKNSALVEVKRITWHTTLDVSNIDTAWGIDLIKAQNILAWTIKNVYLSDKFGSRANLLPWMQWGGTSNLPLESFLMKLKASAYDGYISLRVKPSEIWGWNDEKVLQNLEYIQRYYKKHFLNYK
jgi:sugar phosphate isomerase/epimerase